MPHRRHEELDSRRAVRLVWRAARLRCPNCAGRGLFRGPLTLHERCPTCGLQFDRGESDYFLGAYLLNLVAVELLLAAVLITIGIATWPSPPWLLLQYGGVALAITGAVACYPFSKLVWLAVDIWLRPVTLLELNYAAVREAPPRGTEMV